MRQAEESDVKSKTICSRFELLALCTPLQYLYNNIGRCSHVYVLVDIQLFSNSFQFPPVELTVFLIIKWHFMSVLHIKFSCPGNHDLKFADISRLSPHMIIIVKINICQSKINLQLHPFCKQNTTLNFIVQANSFSQKQTLVLCMYRLWRHKSVYSVSTITSFS